jgi:hypothetical protein
MTWDDVRTLLHETALHCFVILSRREEVVLMSRDGQLITRDPDEAAAFLRDVSRPLPKARAYLCTRRNYVAVQIVPDGAAPIVILNRATARERGILILNFGEGYRRRSGRHSAYGQAIAAAKAYIAASGHIDAGEY